MHNKRTHAIRYLLLKERFYTRAVHRPADLSGGRLYHVTPALWNVFIGINQGLSRIPISVTFSVQDRDEQRKTQTMNALC